MPYIKKGDRRWLSFHTDIDSIPAYLSAQNPGLVNYFISKIIWTLFDRCPSYNAANSLLGVLDAVSKEFYRRKVAPYEDEKIKENGDIQK